MARITPSVRRIMDAVSKYFAMPVSELLLTMPRDTEHVFARAVLAHLLFNREGMSYAAIGRLMDTDHHTIMSRCKKVDKASGSLRDMLDGVAKLLDNSESDRQVSERAAVVNDLSRIVQELAAVISRLETL